MHLVFVGAGVCVFLYVSRWFFSRKWLDISSDAYLSSKSAQGKVIIITGGNAGLGKDVAHDLAKRGATVILACRNVVQGEETARSINKSIGHSAVKFLFLDLASLDSIQNFSKRFLSDYTKLDCLICNAGVWVPMDKELKTRNGYEIHFGINHLGHFMLVKLLSNSLQEAKGSRIVVVSSGLMSSGVVDCDNIDVYKGRQSDPIGIKRPSYAPRGYCDSKLMNGLFVKELADKEKNITSVAVCPGWCKTNLARNVSIPLYKKLLFLPFMFMFMRTSKQGANNIIYCAIQDVDHLKSGGFYRDGKIQVKEDSKLETLKNEGTSQKLWLLSEKLCTDSEIKKTTKTKNEIDTTSSPKSSFPSDRK